MSKEARPVLGLTKGMEGSDGADVKLRRYVGTPELNILDPFLMLDVFGTDEPQDYIGGFPSHPHRGFETVTYMLAGQMRHKDNAGHEGVIVPGGVQWMSAGRGIVHSEMPEQEEGLMKGFQLWINLPAKAKMGEPGYQEFPPEEMPIEELPDGGSINVVAGTTNAGTTGPVKNPYTDPIYMDVRLAAGQKFIQDVPSDHNAFIYITEGQAKIADEDHVFVEGDLAVLGDGDEVRVESQDGPVRILLVTGKPLNEPVARGGPFVMNTREEVIQAFHDYQSGKF
ncbi:pirin family protein [Sneathiella limimaris]|uniref:pirin family protein n=1 Tax=Sneathiella limimaris TaxID=1964213 RepID=UPI00146CA63C|nr:pirin family protein [Sneathiella limimaris]